MIDLQSSFELNQGMHDHGPPSGHESDCKKIDELRRRGFAVHVTRYAAGEPSARYYCQIRNAIIDDYFYAETKGMALAKALESLRPEGS